MAPLMRQSCDRCHSQKLRCPRAANKFGACDRCRRKGAQCVYSCSLPKGRPSVYNIAGKSGDTTARSRDATAACASPLPNVHTGGSRTGSANSYSYAGLLEDTIQTANARSQPDLDSTSLLAHSVDQELNLLGDSQPPLGSSAWSSGQANYCNLSLTQPAHTIIGLSQPLDNTACFGINPGLMDWASLGNGLSGVQSLPPLSGYRPELQISNHTIQNSVDDSNSDDASKTIITQLSQLIMRFPRLHRLSYDLAPKLDLPYLTSDLKQGYKRPLIDETTFGSVSEWLVNYSPNISQHSRSAPTPTKEVTTSHVLCRVFSASHTFLEALHGLRTNVQLDDTRVPRSAAPTIGPNMSSYFTPDTASALYPQPPSHHCNSVVRHLAITCYTMLLSIYVSILNTLEHDASANRHLYRATSGDICLASIVQLCSYLIERQRKAMEIYLTAHKPPQVSWEELLNSSSDQTSATTEEEMRNLNIEVEQRLVRLQRTLHS